MVPKPDTKPSLPPINIKYSGLYDLNSLLKAIYTWYNSEYYNFTEAKQKYKPSEREIKFHGDRKLNEYVRFNIDVDMFFFDIKEVEVIKEGKKLKMQDGKVIIDIKGFLELDWQRRFGGVKYFQYLQDFYHKYIIKQTISEDWEDTLYFKMQQLARMINQRLGMEGSVLYG
jgi:hypothetical protein